MSEDTKFDIYLVATVTAIVVGLLLIFISDRKVHDCAGNLIAEDNHISYDTAYRLCGNQ